MHPRVLRAFRLRHKENLVSPVGFEPTTNGSKVVVGPHRFVSYFIAMCCYIRHNDVCTEPRDARQYETFGGECDQNVTE